VIRILCGAVFGWLSALIMAVQTIRARFTHLVIGTTGAVFGGLLNGLLSDHPRPYHFWNVDSWATAVMSSSLLLFMTTERPETVSEVIRYSWDKAILDHSNNE
jgi:uncharacterized membrane protein YeaQ/YmgE (transglycosylase-associated protein family)